MKKTALLLAAVSLCTSSFADESQGVATDDSQGIAAAESSRSGREGSWQTWVIAGGALVAGAVAVVVVSLDQGTSAH